MQEIHKVIIENPDKWMMGTILPLIRADKDRPFEKELGVILKRDLHTVYLINIFCMPRTQFELNRIPCIVYDSVDKLLGDGWIVD